MFKRGDVLVLLDNSGGYENVADVGDVFVVVEPVKPVKPDDVLRVRRLPGPRIDCWMYARRFAIDYWMYARRFAKVGEVQDAV